MDIYYTQDYIQADETDVSTALARNSETGKVDVSGDGQVNFKVNLEEGYVITSVKADQNYKNVKGSGRRYLQSDKDYWSGNCDCCNTTSLVQKKGCINAEDHI